MTLPSEENSRHRLKAIALLDGWLADDTGYDEQTWPDLETALDRDRLSGRKLFYDAAEEKPGETPS